MGLRLLLALVVGLGLLITPRLEHRLEVRFLVTVQTVPPGNTPRLDLFHARGDQGMRAERSASWPLVLETPVSIRWEQSGLHPVTRLRIDPLASEGQVRLEAITLRGPGGEQVLAGPRLLAAWDSVDGLDASLAPDGSLLLRSLENDPQLLLTVPAGLQHPGLAALWPGWPAVALVTLVLWGLLTLGHRLGLSGPPLTRLTLAIALCLVLSLLADIRISERPVAGDGVQNLRIAHNLAAHGVYSLDPGPVFTPTSVREPVPVLATAAYLSLLDIGTGSGDFSRLKSGDLVQDGKRIQLVWHALGLMAFALLGLMLTGSLLLTAAVLLLSDALFFGPRVDLHYTELHAGALMGWIAVFGLGAVRARTMRWQVLALLATGVALGALALTKSLFFYGLPLAASGLAVALYWKGRQGTGEGAGRLRQALLGAALTAGCASLLVSPWLLRNHTIMGSWSLSEGRSGWVMHQRALLNTLSPEQQLGALVLYAPDGLRRVMDRLGLGIEPEAYLRADGFLAPLHTGASEFQRSDWRARASGQPQEAVSFHQQSAARYMKLLRAGEAAGLDRPDLFADRMLTTIGLARIGNDPVAHLLSTPLLLWRGLWMFPFHNGELPWTQAELSPGQIAALNGLGWLAVIGLLVVAVRRRRAGMLILVGLPLLSLAGYSLTSHNLPRFQTPLIPFLLLALAWSGQLLATALISSGSRRLRRSPGRGRPEHRCTPRRSTAASAASAPGTSG